ncbi:uncharacterized protein [Musca autumnalis]|uniref:uncharacterized protein n=1 Tax=Musca autumnalis TaxID=221902 RepID=UPI003CF2F8E0
MSVTPHTRFVKASDIFLKRVASFERSSEYNNNVQYLEIRSSEFQKLWHKFKCAYDECKNYLTASETAQAGVIDVVEEKYGTSYIAYLRCLSTIDRHLKRLKSSGTETPSPAIAPPISPPPQDELLNVSKETQSPGLLSSKSLEISPPPKYSLNLAEVATPPNRSLDESVPSVPVQSASPSVPAPPETFCNPCNCYSDPVANSTSPVDTHRISLPPIDIDVFAGDFMTWPSFRDLFTTLFVENSRLSDIERLCYLLQKTTGEAREIVSSFPLTNSSFPLAWKALSDTYDNKRIVVNSHIQQLLSLPSLDKETCSGLKTIQRGISSCLAAMTVYDVITDHWDPIVVCICLQRLPKLTLTLWEQSIKNKSSLPSWRDLDAFLTERIQTLVCIHNMYGNQLTDSSPNNVALSKSSKQSLSKSKTSSNSSAQKYCCPICPHQSHVLRVCPRFKELSFEDKFSIVKKYKCCLNCLTRGHVVKSCQSKHSCNWCKQRHHNLLHRPQVRRVLAPDTSKLSPSFTVVKRGDPSYGLSQPRHPTGSSTLPCTSTTFTNAKSRESKCNMSTRSSNKCQSNLPDTNTLQIRKVVASSTKTTPAFTDVKSREHNSTFSHPNHSPAFTKVKSRVFGPSLSRSNTSPAFTKVKSRVFTCSLSRPCTSPAFTNVKSRETADKNKLNPVPIPSIDNNVLLETAKVNIVHNGKSHTKLKSATLEITK